MAGKSTAFANELLKLIFNGTSIANIADNAASSPITNWELSLHTALPTSGQNHNEVTYTGYARVPVARTSAEYFHKIAATVDGIDPTAEHLAEFVAYVQSAQQQGKLRALDFVGLKWLLQNRPAA